LGFAGISEDSTALEASEKYGAVDALLGEGAQDISGEAAAHAPAQERELERVLWRCRTLYNTALEQRIVVWRPRGVSLKRSQQEAELKALRAEMPEYDALNSHVLQDVLARLEKTYQALFRRAANGEKPGFPRYHGRECYYSFTYKE